MLTVKKGSALRKEIRLGNSDWVKYGMRVAAISVADSEVTIRTGHICSTPTSHVGVDNINRVIVWFDEPWRDAEDIEDEHEKGFDVTDPHLFGASEIGLLRYPDFRRAWFDGLYTEIILVKIGEAIAKLTDSDLDGSTHRELLQEFMA